MPLLALLITGTTLPTAHADTFVLSKDDGNETGLRMILSGAAGGVGEELFHYFERGGADRTTSGARFDGAPSSENFLAGSVRSSRSTSHEGTAYTTQFPVLAKEIPDLDLHINLAPTGPITSGRPITTITLPDAASATLYALMEKAGVNADPDDTARTLYGKNVTCWAFHGFPGGQTTPHLTCQINL